MINLTHGLYKSIKTTLIEDRQQNMSSVSIWFQRGYALDTPDSQGLSQLLLSYSGTKSFITLFEVTLE